MTDRTQAAARVAAYLDRHAKSRQNDQTSIHAYDLGEPTETELLVADLRTLSTPAPVEDLLFYKLKDLIRDQSEGEWDDETIIKDAHRFASAIRPMLNAPDPEVATLILIRSLLDHVDRETCTHENLKRGGSIWTICEDCGRKWADDEGGFKPHVDAPAVRAARNYLKAHAK